MRVQMLGLCRFSYVGLRGYQVEHPDFASRRAFLYDPARLARRWFWFTRIALPAWRTQSDPDFTLVIMTGPDLPQPYLSQLQELVAEQPQLRLALVPPMQFHRKACRIAIAPHLDPSADVIGHFRHDDDDAVALDYIASSRRDFGLVAPLWQQQRKLSLDYSRGLMLELESGRLKATPRICHNMGVALTVFLPPDEVATALDFNHMQLAQWMPGVAVTAPVMFLRGIHRDSDSGAIGPGMPWQLEAGALDDLLWQRFCLRRGQIDEAARTLA
jgi:hypothetical protein